MKNNEKVHDLISSHEKAIAILEAIRYFISRESHLLQELAGYGCLNFPNIRTKTHHNIDISRRAQKRLMECHSKIFR